jgi:hypothetical protein
LVHGGGYLARCCAQCSGEEHLLLVLMLVLVLVGCAHMKVACIATTATTAASAATATTATTAATATNTNTSPRI